jgi:hypothetical protein
MAELRDELGHRSHARLDTAFVLGCLCNQATIGALRRTGELPVTLSAAFHEKVVSLISLFLFLSHLFVLIIL